MARLKNTCRNEQDIELLSYTFLMNYFVDDLSYNKFATQSHTFANNSGYDANNAVDRNTATCMRTKPIGFISPDKTVWWKVDLGRVYSIYSINLQFKNSSFYGMLSGKNNNK